MERKKDIIVIGTSAGGVEALSYLVKHLPSNLNASLMVVLHVPTHATSVLPRILNRAETLVALHPQNNEEIVTGRIYVAPPDYHLLVKPGYVSLVRGPRENNHRPAIDPLFRSAARAYGGQVIGVLLTGVLDDGTAGLQAVKIRGGTAIVQSPEDAVYAGMPRSAIENVNDIDYILPLSEIPQVLIELVNTPVEAKAENAVSHQMEIETDLADMNMESLSNNDRAGKPSTFGCPDCGGTLWELEQENLLRFRCRIGHAYSLENLLAKQSDALEDALWFALRALEEKASLSKRMAKRMRDRNQDLAANRLEEQAQDSLARANVIRETLLGGNANTEEKPN
ncbi:MAG: chemotaxis protein CheB [Cyanobacteriota bacterium]|nr:chemotaxis protein CheB [Cyanobacteriota bacterium]